MSLKRGCFILFWFVVAQASAQLNKKEVKRDLDGLNYTLIDEKPEPIRFNPNKKVIKGTGLGSALFTYMIWGLVILALAVLLFFLLRKFRYSKETSLISEDELLGDAIPETEVLRRANLDKILSKETNPKAIIRLLFLKVLQQMVRANLLTTKPSKTNRQYIQDLSSYAAVKEFKHLVSIYEEAWFSSHETNDKHVNDAQNLKSKISKAL